MTEYITNDEYKAMGVGFSTTTSFNKMTPAWYSGPTEKLPGASLLREVCFEFGVTLGEMKGRRGKRHISQSRFAFAYLMRHRVGRNGEPTSWGMIGKLLGGRDHSTVIYSYRRATELLTSDADFAHSIATIEGLDQ